MGGDLGLTRAPHAEQAVGEAPCPAIEPRGDAHRAVAPGGAQVVRPVGGRPAVCERSEFAGLAFFLIRFFFDEKK